MRSLLNVHMYNEQWFVYIARCRDSVLYVGIAKDVEGRLKDHNSGRCRYTKFRRPLKLIYKEMCTDYNSARKRELQIKKYSRKKKIELAERIVLFQ